MPLMSGQEWTFNTVAGQYEKMRPGYPLPLYADVFQYLPIDASSHVLEIGIGGGQATQPVLQTGCRLTAVELGEALAGLCQKKFEAFPRFSVITGRFEETALEPNSYDLIYSASAFHWIPEEAGYRKVFALLKSGGAFARFANRPYKDKGREGLHEAIQKIYAVYMPGSPPKFREYGEEDAARCADIAHRYGFIDIAYRLYHRTRTFTSQEYIALLGTYSDHIAIEEGIRKRFFGEIAEVIDSFGGEITIYDTIDLQLCRKP